MGDQVGNYLRQDKRFRKANSTSGKKGLFSATLQRILNVGGGNKSELKCQGVAGTEGAKTLKNLSSTLIMCESTINTSCSTANLPLPNVTEVDTCLVVMTSFKAMVDACLLKSGSASCSCWSNSSFSTLANKIKKCKLSDDSKA